MATSKPVEPEPNVEEAVQQILAMEGGEEDPLDNLCNKEIAEIYHKLSPSDRQLFRQFKRFHKLHYELYNHDAPSHHLAHGIVKEMFSGIPTKDAETIAAARAEILAEERIRDLCKQLGLAVPVELQSRVRPEAPKYPPPPPPLRFPSRQDEERQQAQAVPSTSGEDVKPPRRLATTYLGRPGLLRMFGAGDEEHVITHVLPGMDPLGDFDEDDPENVIMIDHETDDELDVDDLSEAGAMSKEELQGLLANVAATQQKTAEAVDALAARVGEMTVEQVDQAAAAVVSEMGHVRGLQEITQAFDKTEIGLILAVGVRKLHKYQCLKGQQEEKDILPYSQLQKKFGPNRRTILECSQGYKHCYPKGIPTKVQFSLSKLEQEEEEQGATADPN